MPDTRDSNRDVRRALLTRCTLPPCYTASVPLWDPQNCKQIGEIAILPPHDILSAMVKREGVEALCSLSSARHGGLRHVLNDFGQRLRLDVTSNPTACIGL